MVQTSEFYVRVLSERERVSERVSHFLNIEVCVHMDLY